MSDAFIEGDLRQKSLSDIWQDPQAFSYNRNFTVDILKGKCKSCQYGKICCGGCRETAYSFTGDFFTPPFCLSQLEATA